MHSAAALAHRHTTNQAATFLNATPTQLSGQQGVQPGILIAPPERKLQTQVASQRLVRFYQRPIHHKSMRTHSRRQRYRVNCSLIDVLKCCPHKFSLFPFRRRPQSHIDMGSLEPIFCVLPKRTRTLPARTSRNKLSLEASES